MTLKTFTMDSNENKCPLMETPAQEVADSIVATNISAAPLQSKEEVIARLEEINQQETTGDKSELDLIKQTFYRLRNAEVELAKKEFEPLYVLFDTFFYKTAHSHLKGFLQQTSLN